MSQRRLGYLAARQLLLAGKLLHRGREVPAQEDAYSVGGAVVTAATAERLFARLRLQVVRHVEGRFVSWGVGDPARRE